MRLQCFPPTRYVKNGEYPWCALFRKILKIAVKLVCLLCMALLCILGVLYGFLDNFFLLSVLVALKKKKKKKGHLGGTDRVMLESDDNIII